MRNNSGIIGGRQTPSTSAAPGFFSLIDQQIIRGAGLWPSSPSQDPAYSIFLDGNADWIEFSASGDFAKNAFFGSGKTFTIETWIYPTSLVTATNYASIVLGDGAPTSFQMCWSVGMSDSKKPHFFWYDGSSKSASVSAALTLNTWTHLAWVASAGSVSIYVNGVSQALTGTTSLTNASETIKMEIGVDRSQTWAGYLSNLRAVRGTAIYTSNFTPPTTNLPAVTGTSLLLGTTNSLTDASSPPKTLTIQGQVAISANVVPWV